MRQEGNRGRGFLNLGNENVLGAWETRKGADKKAQIRKYAKRRENPSQDKRKRAPVTQRDDVGETFSAETPRGAAEKTCLGNKR